MSEYSKILTSKQGFFVAGYIKAIIVYLPGNKLRLPHICIILLIRGLAVIKAGDYHAI
jgi:hypothetical protein